MTPHTRALRYSDPYLCPDCSARLPERVTSCPGCDLTLNSPLASELLSTLRTADELLVRLRATPKMVPPVPAVRAADYGDAPHQVIPYPRLADARAGGQPARNLSAPSVPKILLGLGALCLLAAAVIFLAVAWSWLGIGGRTAVLVTLTAASGALGVLLARRGLRVAGESLTTVALGLLCLDVVGAAGAGWIGQLDAGGVLCTVGAAVGVAGLALALTSRLSAPQLVSVLGTGIVGLGAVASGGQVTTVAGTLVLGLTGFVAAGRALGLRMLWVSSILAAAGWWTLLTLLAARNALLAPSFSELWGAGHGVALLAAALLLAVPLPLTRQRPDVARALVGVCAPMLTILACLPVLDESATAWGVVATIALAFWTTVLVPAPARWRAVPAGSVLLAALPATAVVGVAVVEAAYNTIGAAAPFTEAAALRLTDYEPSVAPALLVPATTVLGLAFAARAWPSATQLTAKVRAHGRMAGTLLALAGVVTVASYPAPVGAVGATLLALGLLALVDAGRKAENPERGQMIVGLALVGAAVVVVLPSAVLTALVAAATAGVAGVFAWTGRTPAVRAGAAALLPAATAGFLWAAASAADVDRVDRAVPVLLCLGVLALVRPRPELETSAVAAGALASVAAVGAASDLATALAVHLTVTGALVSAHAVIHPSRRVLAWVGGALLAAATWVRLAELDVTAPEAYTMPAAIALLLVGLDRLRRDSATSTVAVLTPGLTLATVPTLTWVLGDPASLRAVLLGAACLALVLAGSSLRWSAPLLVGAGVGAIVVLRELVPYALATPQWILIGAAGTLLTVVGVTWERRLRDLRAASAYIARLR